MTAMRAEDEGTISFRQRVDTLILKLGRVCVYPPSPAISRQIKVGTPFLWRWGMLGDCLSHGCQWQHSRVSQVTFSTPRIWQRLKNNIFLIASVELLVFS